MICPICGYALSAFDKTCPRCELLKQRANLTTPFSGSDGANVIVATRVPKGSQSYKAAIALVLIAIVAIPTTFIWKGATERASDTSASLNNTGIVFARAKENPASSKHNRRLQADTNDERFKSRQKTEQQFQEEQRLRQEQEAKQKSLEEQANAQELARRQGDMQQQDNTNAQELARQQRELQQQDKANAQELVQQQRELQQLQQLDDQILEYNNNLSRLSFSSKTNYGVFSVEQIISESVNAPNSPALRTPRQRDPRVLTVAQAYALAQRTVQLGDSIVRNPSYRRRYREPRSFDFFIPINPMYPDRGSKSFEFFKAERL